MERKIIHIDADYFFAAIEIRDNPDIRGYPVAIGGTSLRSGIVATCSYEARRLGIKAAMPMHEAQRLCPDLIIISPNFKKYNLASAKMRSIFSEFTSKVEPISLDEAYLDVTGTDTMNGSATWIAEEIRARIQKEVGITVSAGVAPNKFLAKVASDWNKPDGIFVIWPDMVESFVGDLPVRKINGVGPVTEKMLIRHGIKTCADLQRYDRKYLTSKFGVFGSRLYDLSFGIDNQEVISFRERKSLSVENTYEVDLYTVDECLIASKKTHIELLDRLSDPENLAKKIVKTFVKLKFSDFTTTTIERAGLKPTKDSVALLIQKGVERKNLPVRLIGIGVKFGESKLQEIGDQMDLFDDQTELDY